MSLVQPPFGRRTASRRTSKATRQALLACLVLISALALPTAVRNATAAPGTCGQPFSDGATPAASDALFVLRAAVGIESCDACICDVDGSGVVSAVDALAVLAAAVGRPVTLDCHGCNATTTSTTSTSLPNDTTTTTLSAPTTTSTSLPTGTTTTSVGGPTTTSTTSTTLLVGLGDADTTTLDRLDDVMDAAVALVAGASFQDVATALRSMDGVSSAVAGGLSLSVVVGGVRGIVHDGAAARVDPAGADPLPFSPEPFDPVTVQGLSRDASLQQAADDGVPTGQRMVGNDVDGDGKRDLPKSALVLSPYAFQFQPYESGLPVRDRLAPLRDYDHEGGVDFVANPPGSSTNAVTLLNWLNWDAYDVIFVSTHGDLVPVDNGFASPMLFTGIGILENSCAGMRDLALAQLDGDRATVNTLVCARVNKGTHEQPNWIRDIAAGYVFFSHVYPGGLQKKLIYLEACRSLATDDLVDALLGEDSIVLGWTEYVFSSFSREVAQYYFGRAGTNGLPAWRAHAVTCQGGACIEPTPPSAMRPGQTGPPELEVRYDRADLRIREGLEIASAPTPGACFAVPDVPLSLTCPSCGGTLPLSMTFPATVDGLLQADLVLRQDPTKFALEQFRLFADADGTESGYALPLFTDNVVGQGDGSYSVLGSATLYVDDVCPGDTVEYEPWVLLPAYDPNMGGIDARDRMYSWDGPFEVQLAPAP
jgi:hypothetical protein